MCSDTIYPTRLSSPFISHPFPPLLLPFPISASSSFVIGFQDSWSFSTKPKKPGRDLLACCWEKKQHQRYLCLKLEKERKRSTKPLFLTNSEDFLDTPNQSKRIQRRNRIIDNRSWGPRQMNSVITMPDNRGRNEQHLRILAIWWGAVVLPLQNQRLHGEERYKEEAKESHRETSTNDQCTFKFSGVKSTGSLFEMRWNVRDTCEPKSDTHYFLPCALQITGGICSLSMTSPGPLPWQLISGILSE